jgi:hypothetical protein
MDRGWKKMPQFKVCNDFETLRADTNSGEIDVFLWEVCQAAVFM